MAKKDPQKKVRAGNSKKSGSKKSNASLSIDVLKLWQNAGSSSEEAGKLALKAKAMARAVDKTHERADAVHQDIRFARKRAARAAHPEAADLDQPTPAKEKASTPFLIVGVGASAGGFEAFVELLKNLPANTGMALVFIQHLDPTHESKLTELLGRVTKMDVVQIRNGMRVLPDHVYIIPFNSGLTISSGVLELSVRKKVEVQSLVIDRFFQSLAEDQGNRAVGVLLSGSGHDGTAGLRSIKGEGGITFAQDEDSSKFFPMPGSAIAAGAVDFVLPPDRIAAELQHLGKHAPLHATERSKTAPILSGSENDLGKIFGLLRAATGVDFSNYKLTTLRRRIVRRMLLKKITNLKNYLHHLQQTPGELEQLFHDILINVTSFFRDPEAFASLQKKILPKILKNKPQGAPIRIWVPGCSSGEEVYSLAICVHEYLGKNASNKAIQIFGTDISENVVGKARAGVYPLSIASQVSPERLRRYFKKNDGGYQIAKFIRDVCIFARQNVAGDPPFSKLDLISCRNLLIYLGPALQRKVMPIFHYSLRPGGYLMLGTSETIGSFSNLFSIEDKKNRIFVKNESYTRADVDIFPRSTAESMEPRIFRAKEEVSHFDLQKKADEVLLSNYVPAGIIVNSRMEVLHFRGKTGPYLEPAPGNASLNLLKIVREELRMDLRTAMTQAMKTNLPVRKEPVTIKQEGRGKAIRIEIAPIKHPHLSDRFFLVLFEDLGPFPESAKGRKPATSGGRQLEMEHETKRLGEELSQTKESLQSIIEEQEATNEELKSANEEIQSSNEELQSTNEELETAKEELQSTNEELTTLNEELQNRNSELSQANNDLNNLIGSFNMPIIMLGNDLTVRRFTPLAQKIFNLIGTDIGRRISDINSNIALPNLDKVVAEVIDTLHVKEMEVQDREGHWYSLRVRPYRTSENKIDGAVIVLVDIADIRQGLEEVAEIVPQPMLILSSDLRVNRANHAFYSTFQVSKEEVEAHSLFRLGNGQWDIPALRHILDSVLPANNRVQNFRVEHDFPKIGRRVFNFNARRLYQHSNGTHYVLVFLEMLPTV
ncbi:MAG: ATPase [Verrucomicrobiales bacterium]|nr:ATPase [Verrucomicrobiales bacterium]